MFQPAKESLLNHNTNIAAERDREKPNQAIAHQKVLHKEILRLHKPALKAFSE